MNLFFFELKVTISNLFKKEYLFLIILGCIATYFLVESGFDWWYFINFRHSSVQMIFFPGIFLGAILPLFLPFIILIVAKVSKSIKNNKKWVIWAGLLGQSAFLGWVASSILKAFTGRIQPNLYDLTTDISHNFNFGFLQHGIFWGWPSSHTSVSFAVSVAVVTVLAKNKINSKNKIICFLVLLYAFYIAISVSLSIHWFSDSIMGIVLGSIVGYEVGKSFRKILGKELLVV